MLNRLIGIAVEFVLVFLAKKDATDTQFVFRLASQSGVFPFQAPRAHLARSSGAGALAAVVALPGIECDAKRGCSPPTLAAIPICSNRLPLPPAVR